MPKKQKPRERHCREQGCNGPGCSCACGVCSSAGPYVPKPAMEWAYAAVAPNGRLAAIDTVSRSLKSFKTYFLAQHSQLTLKGYRFVKVLITETMDESTRNRLGKGRA